MDRSAITPHISWSGPQPERDVDAYLLAMLLRIYSSGLTYETEEKRDKMAAPSVLTTDNMPVVAIMYAFYKSLMEERGVNSVDGMLRLVKEVDDEAAVNWYPGHEEEIQKAERELIDYVDTPGNAGFRCFG